MAFIKNAMHLFNLNYYLLLAFQEKKERFIVPDKTEKIHTGTASIIVLSTHKAMKSCIWLEIEEKKVQIIILKCNLLVKDLCIDITNIFFAFGIKWEKKKPKDFIKHWIICFY